MSDPHIIDMTGDNQHSDHRHCWHYFDGKRHVCCDCYALTEGDDE